MIQTNLFFEEDTPQITPDEPEKISCFIDNRKQYFIIDKENDFFYEESYCNFSCSMSNSAGWNGGTLEDKIQDCIKWTSERFSITFEVVLIPIEFLKDSGYKTMHLIN